MIIIQNVSKKYSTTGWQDYQVRINDEQICKFKHLANDGLAKCLARAGSAVYKARKKPNNSQPS
jgi:hypothetical protein